MQTRREGQNCKEAEGFLRGVFFELGPCAESRVAARLRSLLVLGGEKSEADSAAPQHINSSPSHVKEPQLRKQAQYISFLTTSIFNT